MWNFFNYITQSILQDKGIFDQFVEQTFVVLINVMNKDPNTFSTQIEAVQTVWNVASKTLENARSKNDEIEALMVVTLLNSLLENIQGLQNLIPMIIDMYLGQLSEAKTPDYTLMLVQGILMCIWYDYGVALGSLQEKKADSQFFQLLFKQIQEERVKEDFEVKRCILGLSALLVPAEMPPSVTENYGNIINALVFLSEKSIKIRNMEVQKEEQAEEQREAPGQIIEDEDDCGLDIESDDEEDDEWDEDDDYNGDDSLYSSPLDKVDEVLHLHSQLAKLQENGGQDMITYLMSQLSPENQQLLQTTAEAA